MGKEVQKIRLDGIEYRLPYADEIEQTVDDDSLVASIQKEGMIYPIVFRKVGKGREIIDGNTRARLIAEGKVELDKIPLERVDVDESERAYDLAIQLNFQRRQISPRYRRKAIKRIHSHKGWRGKPSSHVKELSELLGVSRSTVSKDIATIWEGAEESSIRQERTKINYLLTGLGYLERKDIKDIDLTGTLTEDEVQAGQKYIQTLQKHLEARRREINAVLTNVEA